MWWIVTKFVFGCLDIPTLPLSNITNLMLMFICVSLTFSVVPMRRWQRPWSSFYTETWTAHSATNYFPYIDNPLAPRDFNFLHMVWSEYFWSQLLEFDFVALHFLDKYLDNGQSVSIRIMNLHLVGDDLIFKAMISPISNVYTFR